MTPPHDALKTEARAWFEQLRDRLCAACEAIETNAGSPARFRAQRLDPAAGRRASRWRAAA